MPESTKRRDHTAGWRRRCAHGIVIVTMLAPAACRTPIAGAGTEREAGGWECLAFRPIAWSGADTEETVRQVREHNAVWEEACMS